MNLRLLKRNDVIISTHDEHWNSYFLSSRGRPGCIPSKNISILLKMLDKLNSIPDYHTKVIENNKPFSSMIPYCSEYKLKQIIKNEILYISIYDRSRI